jgi:5-methylcytosine-specific restriction endonuclease McrA
MAKDTFYFQHDYNARNDEKILELRASYGPLGYGVFWMLIETMAENENAGINRKFITGLSISYGLAKDELIKIIDQCLYLDLFFEEGGFLFSKRLLKHMDFRTERAETGKRGAEKKWSTVREKKAIFKEMVLFFNNTCVRCRGESGLLNVERDHIIPSYQGGPDTPYNWQPLCARCNSSKGPERIDHRIKYCIDHGLTMPESWLSEKEPIAKNGIGKERIEKDKKVIFGVSFSEDMKAVTLTDGTIQELDLDQLRRVKEGGYKPHYVKKK